MTANKAIYFDMDGTIADLYSVDNWLNDLINSNVRPYAVAKPLLNMQVLARILNKLKKKGYTIGIISWLSKSGTDEYNEKVAKVKQKWLKTHLKSVEFDEINIVKYGTPKSTVCNITGGILFDDEERNRTEWNGTAYNVNEILTILKGLTKAA